jgi:hypothetical protein
MRSAAYLGMSKASLVAAAVSPALIRAAAADTVQGAKSAGEKWETVFVTGIRASL